MALVSPMWFRLFVALLWRSFTFVPASLSPRASAPLLDPSRAPLRTEGRYIVDTTGERIKWACVNWYGAYSGLHVVGGLEVRPLDEIVTTIVELGFNCVRLCYATDSVFDNPNVTDDAVLANPQFKGKRFFDVWDATVAAITRQGLMVIINNHNHKSGWCCSYDQDEGLWYNDRFTTEMWIEGLVNMTIRHRDDPLVVAIDLRNEVHDYRETWLTWGEGSEKCDWAAAATRAGNEVLKANPSVLIVVMGLCFGMELRPAREHPIKLIYPQRVVYQVHNYIDFQWWMLVSKTFGWDDTRDRGIILIFVSAFIIGLVLVAWYVLNQPAIPKGVLIVSVGSWVFTWCILALGILSIVYSIEMRFCRWQAGDYVGWFVGISVVLVLGFFMILFGCRRHRKASLRVVVCEDSERVKTADAEVQEAPPTPLHTEVPTERHSTPEQARGERVGETPKQQPVRCCCCMVYDRGIGSWRELGARLRNNFRPWIGLWGRPREPPPPWDCGMCCCLQILLCCSIAIFCLIVLTIFAAEATQYSLLERHFDKQWGFLLQEGHDYSAPVWLGEWGAQVRGQHWLQVAEYMSKRDLDWAYWAINGKKWTEGQLSQKDGSWQPYDVPRWENESYGVLHSDYRTIRSPWKLTDLRSIATSPPSWPGDTVHCDRSMSTDCGG